MQANSKSFSKLIISWAFVNKEMSYICDFYLDCVPLQWCGKGKVKGSFPPEFSGLKSDQPASIWFFTLLYKSRPNTGRALQGLQQCQPAQNPDGPVGQGSLEQRQKCPEGKNLCCAISPAERLHPLHTQEEKMANICFFGHPFPTAWDTQVWALESTRLDKCVPLIFLLNSNMNSSWLLIPE